MPHPSIIGAAAVAALAVAAACPAGAESVIYSFTGGTDGAHPFGGLVADAKGNLYGTTFGIPNTATAGAYGTVFELSPPAAGQGAWTETVLYRFTGGADGLNPQASLILDSAGALYGTTIYGGYAGTNFCQPYGCGVVFKLTPPAGGATAWTQTVLHSFTGPAVSGGTAPADGSNPTSALIADTAGHLYGTTSAGGSTFTCGGGCGTVFRLSPPAAGKTAWGQTLLHNFAASASAAKDGLYPASGLAADSTGALYGATPQGGGNSATCGRLGCGTVFRLTPPASGHGAWPETVLRHFTGSTHDGWRPAGGVVLDKAGDVYGATVEGGAVKYCQQGCGVVYELSVPAAGKTAWGLHILHYFDKTAETEGLQPSGGLIADSTGNLYGTTLLGGLGAGGTAYKLAVPAAGKTAWRASVLQFFGQGSDIYAPESGVIEAGGKLYGAGYSGGADSAGGIFEVAP